MVHCCCKGGAGKCLQDLHCLVGVQTVQANHLLAMIQSLQQELILVRWETYAWLPGSTMGQTILFDEPWCGLGIRFGT